MTTDIAIDRASNLLGQRGLVIYPSGGMSTTKVAANLQDPL
ncbi:MAG TPA: hypothetical protein VL371_16000 [Gemmataceae bacterium]|jgi:hypothetical protein|nr:hypothetical protein [Gemmataceae bacterium]